MRRMTVILLYAAYVVSPIDVLPEIVLGPLGLADDVVAFLVGLRTVRGGRAGVGRG